MIRSIFGFALLSIATTLPVHRAMAEDVIVVVDGSQDVQGDIACRLYSGPRNFPFGAGTAGEVRASRSSDGTACIFRGVSAGNYALVVAILPRGQNDITRDFLGRPRQPWGVSNNVRHAMRPPRYDEAVFTVTRGSPRRVRVTLKK